MPLLLLLRLHQLQKHFVWESFIGCRSLSLSFTLPRFLWNHSRYCVFIDILYMRIHIMCSYVFVDAWCESTEYRTNTVKSTRCNSNNTSNHGSDGMGGNHMSRKVAARNMCTNFQRWKIKKEIKTRKKTYNGRFVAINLTWLKIFIVKNTIQISIFRYTPHHTSTHWYTLCVMAYLFFLLFVVDDVDVRSSKFKIK